MSRAQDLFDRLVAGGAAEVSAFISEPVTEELFLDYKRSVDNGAGTKLDNGDRRNLAKAISGFGNSEGGVIVWGVDCRPDASLGDIPTAAVPIQSPTKFKSWLESATSGLTVPPHSGVRHHAIEGGFVATLIPAGMHAPYQVAGEGSYYIRAGSNFVKTPHAVLAGMFGRRPQPSIKHHYSIPDLPTLDKQGIVKTQIGIMVRNFGRGIASDVFLNLQLPISPGRNCSISYSASEDQETWTGNTLWQHRIQMMTKAGVRLAPECSLEPLTVKMKLQLPIEKDFVMTGTCGCGDGETHRFEFRRSIYRITGALDPLSNMPVNAVESAFNLKRFNQIFFAEILKE